MKSVQKLVLFGQWVFVLVSFCLLVSSPRAAYAFYSDTGKEVEATFEHEVLLPGTGVPQESYVQQYLAWYFIFSAGPLAKGQVYGAKGAAAAKFDGQFQTLGSRLDPATGQYFVRYSYRGTILVQKSVRNRLEFIFPKDPSRIYEQAQIPDETDPVRRNPCTDAVYNDDGHFWYFWSPERKGCRLKAGVHYDSVTAQIRDLPSTVQTYPDYDRLLDGAGQVDVTLIFGADKDELGTLPPEGNPDYDAVNFMEMKRRLESRGFQSRRWRPADFQNFCGRSLDGLATVEEFEKRMNGKRILIRMLWGTTSFGSHSLPFYCMLDHATARGSVFLYNGHSGMGAAVYLKQIRALTGLKLKLNTDQYQIFSFNGCSSYGYYNTEFFAEKVTAGDPTGSRNMDVVTNGVAGNFLDLVKMSEGILNAIHDATFFNRRASWQSIIDGFKNPYMTSINGDE